MSTKLIYHQNWNITKTEISFKCFSRKIMNMWHDPRNSFYCCMTIYCSITFSELKKDRNLVTLFPITVYDAVCGTTPATPGLSIIKENIPSPPDPPKQTLFTNQSALSAGLHLLLLLLLFLNFLLPLPLLQLPLLPHLLLLLPAEGFTLLHLGESHSHLSLSRLDTGSTQLFQSPILITILSKQIIP